MGLGHVLTANWLSDGVVVFLTAAGVWSERIDDAVLARESQAAAALERRGVEFEGTNLVTGAYLVEAERNGGAVTPIHIRERIRARGPTVAHLHDRVDAAPRPIGGDRRLTGRSARAAGPFASAT